jgi:hypothetical protein
VPAEVERVTINFGTSLLFDREHFNRLPGELLRKKRVDRGDGVLSSCFLFPFSSIILDFYPMNPHEFHGRHGRIRLAPAGADVPALPL